MLKLQKIKNLFYISALLCSIQITKSAQDPAKPNANKPNPTNSGSPKAKPTENEPSDSNPSTPAAESSNVNEGPAKPTLNKSNPTNGNSTEAKPTESEPSELKPITLPPAKPSIINQNPAKLFYTIPYEIEEINVQGGRYVGNDLYLFGYRAGESETIDTITIIKPDRSITNLKLSPTPEDVISLTCDGSTVFYKDDEDLFTHYALVPQGQDASSPTEVEGTPMYQNKDVTARALGSLKTQEGDLRVAGEYRNNAVLWNISPEEDKTAGGSQFTMVENGIGTHSYALGATDIGDRIRIVGKYNDQATFWDLIKGEDFTDRVTLVPPTHDKELYSEATTISPDGQMVFGTYITKASYLYLSYPVDPFIWPSNAYDFLDSWAGTYMFLYNKSSMDVNDTFRACVWYPVKGGANIPPIAKDLERALIEGYTRYMNSVKKSNPVLAKELNGTIRFLKEEIDILGVDDISADGSRIFCKTFLQDEEGRMQPRFIELTISFGDVNVLRQNKQQSEVKNKPKAVPKT